jgi:hypothetical protein
MTDARPAGRWIGLMLLLQFVGMMVGFVLITDPLRATDYVTSAAANAVRIQAGLIVLLANCALTVGISISAWRVFRDYSQTGAMWLIVLSVLMLVIQALDGVHVMSMVSLSQQHAAGASGISDALAASVRASRRWAHYLELIAIDAWLLTFYSLPLRFALIPRLLALFAIVTVALHFVSVPLPGFLGYGINTNLGIPMALGMVAVAVWLTVKGFAKSGELS